MVHEVPPPVIVTLITSGGPTTSLQECHREACKPINAVPPSIDGEAGYGQAVGIPAISLELSIGRHLPMLALALGMHQLRRPWTSSMLAMPIGEPTPVLVQSDEEGRHAFPHTAGSALHTAGLGHPVAHGQHVPCWSMAGGACMPRPHRQCINADALPQCGRRRVSTAYWLCQRCYADQHAQLKLQLLAVVCSSPRERCAEVIRGSLQDKLLLVLAPKGNNQRSKLVICKCLHLQK